MNKTLILAKTDSMLLETFGSEPTGHDYWHMRRTAFVAKRIVTTEPAADPFVTELAAWLHDIADWEFHGGDEEAGPRAARAWLAELEVPEPIIAHIEDIIRHVSFKGAKVAHSMRSIEGKIVHDADKLDAIGAIGIARTFAYGGYHHRAIYDPRIKPVAHDTFEAYKNNVSPTLNHFDEKLLLLKDRMLTAEGRRIAEHRHTFMEAFLQEFHRDWEVGAV